MKEQHDYPQACFFGHGPLLMVMRVGKKSDQFIKSFAFLLSSILSQTERTQELSESQRGTVMGCHVCSQEVSSPAEPIATDSQT